MAISPAGIVSRKEMPVTGTALGFVKVNVSVVIPPPTVSVGELNFFVRSGGCSPAGRIAIEVGVPPVDAMFPLVGTPLVGLTANGWRRPTPGTDPFAAKTTNL